MKSLYSLAIMALLAAPAGFGQRGTDRAAARFLDQATWGPTPPAIAQFEDLGITDWLNAQFALNTSDLPDQPILDSAGNSNNNLAPVQAAFFQNAVTGQDQLRQRVAFILSQIWVVSATIRRFPGLCLSALLAHLPRQRVRQLSRHHQGRDAQPRHGPLSQHGQQQQSQYGQGHRRERELRAVN